MAKPQIQSLTLGEELYKYLCFRSNPINYLYLSMYMYVVLNYEINMFKLVPLLSGVPQRSVLGPVLFLIFINDLPDNIRSSVRLFADDCVLYRNIKTLTDCQILQDDLNSLGQWETDCQMSFNEGDE